MQINNRKYTLIAYRCFEGVDQEVLNITTEWLGIITVMLDKCKEMGLAERLVLTELRPTTGEERCHTYYLDKDGNWLGI